MKKILLFVYFLITIAATIQVSAQTSVIVQRNDRDCNIISTVVCEYHHTQTITCFNTTSNKAVFVLDTQIHQTIAVELENYYINDMTINETEDTLFFCGRTYGGHSKGIIGFFRIPSVFNSSGNIFVQDYIYADENNRYVAELTRMIYYRKTDGTPYLACIGCTNDGYPCLVDMNMLPLGGYIAGYVQNEKEKFTDIKSIYDHKDFNAIYCINDFHEKVCAKKEVALFIDCPTKEEQE